MLKRRVDLLLVEKGLAESRERARALVLAGDVLADEIIVPKPGSLVWREASLRLRPRPLYASRGGEKLAHALDSLGLDVKGMVALDVGASTGGFTDCLLKRGAARVYAVDVGRGQLDYHLRNDPRVVVMEGVNARYLERLPELVDLATIDVSFISLEKVIPAVLPSLKPEGHILALVKPQFEAGKGQVGKGGVVKEAGVHAQVLRRFLVWAKQEGLGLRGLLPAPILGSARNQEFFAYLACSDGGLDAESEIARLLGNGIAEGG